MSLENQDYFFPAGKAGTEDATRLEPRLRGKSPKPLLNAANNKKATARNSIFAVEKKSAKRSRRPRLTLFCTEVG